jgi:hypothetical protein
MTNNKIKDFFRSNSGIGLFLALFDALSCVGVAIPMVSYISNLNNIKKYRKWNQNKLNNWTADTYIEKDYYVKIIKQYDEEITYINERIIIIIIVIAVIVLINLSMGGVAMYYRKATNKQLISN